MKFASTPRWAASLAALVLWALVAASALYWVWRVRAPPAADAPVAGLMADAPQAADPQAVARALGAAGARVAAGGDADGRFALRGVVTHGPNAGAALIAVDGKLPKPVRVGAPVADADGWTLRAVTRSGAVIASGARQITLDVPQPDAQKDTYADTGLETRGAPATPVMPAPLPMPIRRGPSLIGPRLPPS